MRTRTADPERQRRSPPRREPRRKHRRTPGELTYPVESASASNFYQPPTADPLYRLVQQPDENIDLAFGALLIARDAYPGLDIDSCLQRIRGLALEVEPRVKGRGAA